MHLLDNIFWHALAGPQAVFASGQGDARRFARGFPPIVAFRNPQQPDFAALAPHCDAGEQLYVTGWTGPAPAGWRVQGEFTMFQMVWDAPSPAPDAHAERFERIVSRHSTRALALVELTRPGPFGPRSPELGEYFGVFEGDRLLAMAGERAHAPGYREVSGVCTHPDAQGRGLARGLMHHLIAGQMARGETPFLHVMHGNADARRLYRRMGFRERLEIAVRMVVPG